MKYQGKNGESFEVVAVDHNNCFELKATEKESLSMIWFLEDDNTLIIDAIEYTYKKGDIIFLTEFHKVETKKVYPLKLMRFNKPFYCILDHDSEVGCKGVLFFGASTIPTLHPNEQEIETLNAVWKMLALEMVSRDNLQLEMLQMMLKRILILCTRVYKNQENYDQLETGSVDIVREFNFLVEKHFKELHTVTDYAELLFKSPKTLSNVFKKLGKKTPLQFIQSRIMLESRRLLKYSDQSVSDIAYELGYNDVQSFSRFFKKHEGTSPLEFKSKS